MTIEQIIAGELSVRPQQAAATLELLDSGNTIPFIARYRKEVTGSLDEEQIRMISERAQYLRNLEERRQEILESITSQEKLTPELESQIKAAVKMQELEDLYLPYRPKKRTRAQIARERGLEQVEADEGGQPEEAGVDEFREREADKHHHAGKGLHGTVEGHGSSPLKWLKGFRTNA